MINMNIDTIVTHNGVFHADDVIAAALICIYTKIKLYDLKVIRTRDPKIIEEHLNRDLSIVFDVGNGEFDHHEIVGKFYTNGVKMAACGKILKSISPSLFDFEEYEEFLEYLYPVEAADNGQDAASLELKPNNFNWVSSINPCWNNTSPEIEEECFRKAVAIAYEILVKMIKRVKAARQAKVIVQEAINASKNGIVFFDQFVPWQKLVCEYNEKNDSKITIIIFKAGDSDYKVQLVPVEFGSFDTILQVPESWKGKRGDELEKAACITGGTFCHPTGFISGWKSEGSARLAAAKLNQ